MKDITIKIIDKRSLDGLRELARRGWIEIPEGIVEGE
jgi:hypothetical protein